VGRFSKAGPHREPLDGNECPRAACLKRGELRSACVCYRGSLRSLLHRDTVETID